MSTIAGINDAAKKIAEQAVRPQTEVKPLEPAPKDVDRFEKALSGEKGPGPVSSGTEPLSPAGPSQAAGSQQTLGDAILQGIEKMKAGQENKVQEIEKTLEEIGDQPMTTQNMMKLQFDLMQLNIQQEVTSKVADKTTQGIQTLFKNQ
jgi:type III secretion system YscI/HrpB-like protein